MKKKFKNKIKLLIAVISSLLILSVFLIASSEKAPFDEIEFARKSILDAKMIKANIYANEMISEAEKLYDSALNEVRKQSNIFFAKRNYEQTRKLALESSSKAIEAKKITLLKSRNLKQYVQIKIDSVESYVNENRKIFIQLPVDKKLFEHFSKGNMLLAESKYAFENKNYKESEIKIDKAFNYLNIAFSSTKQILDTYFENYSNWINWTDDAIVKSKKEKKKAIIIDKFSKKIYVYKNGLLAYTSDIELGKNWIGDKNFSGDKTTPEGKYRIINKKSTNQTKYYKALLIDYPNDDDIKRFNHAKKEGLIPRTAKIGGLIEIHGDGGKGTDWTDGCIALSNEDMNFVFNSSEVGTPVIIVGSLLHLSEINN